MSGLNQRNSCALMLTAALTLTMSAAATGGTAAAAPARKSPFNVLYSFTGGADGGSPFADLTADSAGNLYGTAELGGNNNSGVVFALAPDGTQTVLYTFTGGSDGGDPVGGLIRDKSGNLYGTTYFGGTGNGGVVFEVAPNGTETVLHTFTGGSDGENPRGKLLKGKKGTLYGTTQNGGIYAAEGTVYELTKTKGGGYTETVLHSFGNGSDGMAPNARLIEDEAGNLYGTTAIGGADGGGTVFKIAPDGTETVLYSFGGLNGTQPTSGLIEDKAGNLYGTTLSGGNGPCGGGSGCGVVFKLAPDGTETVLHDFQGGNDGQGPAWSGVFADKKGNLYGTTEGGGADNAGVVYKIAPSGTETVLYTFNGGSDGASPRASLIQDTPDGKSDLFGTTFGGGSGNGVVFEIKK